jgi:hypothetical protein
MDDDKDQIIADLRQALAVLNGELTVARAEITMLEEQRSATRLYLGVGLESNDEEAPPGDAKWVLVNGINKILANYPDQKIRQIKELRNDTTIASAYFALGGTLDGIGNCPAGFTLKQAKDILDGVWQYRTIHIPGKMTITL